MLVCKEQFEVINDGLLVRAPAKINLSLLIAGKRPDGFHDIETIMAKINFYDELLIEQGHKPGIELICEGPHWAPEGKENLVYKAAEVLLTGCGRTADIKIILTKNIPAGSGLGSASSDAAAALLGLNRYLDLQFSESKLAELAALLGSDVPFFLDGPLAQCSGKGEKIEKLSKNFNFLAFLILPNVSVSTKKVYANYDHDAATYEKLRIQINDHIKKNNIDLVSKMCTNMLEKSCFRMYKELVELKAKAEALGLRPLCLSGSGSAMFCIVNNREGKKFVQYRSKLQEQIRCEIMLVSNNRW